MKQQILIIGAGTAGKELFKEIKKQKLDLVPIGFVDDDKKKFSKKVLGLPILGDRHELKKLVAEFGIDKILIALPSADGEIIAEILKTCVELGIPCQIVPRVREIIEGTVDLRRIREVQIEDLLERPVRKHDIADVTHLIKNKTVLVTGAAGSIGSELCRQIASYSPDKVIMYDWWENGLYELGIEFKEFFPECTIVLVPGSIQDSHRVNSTLKKYAPSILFHAAAYKHVPLMENNVLEAVKNNILGTHTVVQAAQSSGVKKFVFISTDKAVNPKSIMGSTKLIGEMITTSPIQNAKTTFISVRFGNVLNSAGSVLPLFRKQLPSGTITVTDKKMTRFFMTIPEAVQLILKATVLGKENEIFILDMGKPIKILDIAKKFILLSGLIPEKDVKIKIIGMRPGEKLNEELSTKSENVTKTKYEKLFVLKKRNIKEDELEELIKNLITCTETDDELQALKILKNFISHYS